MFNLGPRLRVVTNYRLEVRLLSGAQLGTENDLHPAKKQKEKASGGGDTLDFQ